MIVSNSMVYIAFLLIASFMGLAKAEDSSALLQKAADGQCIDGVTLEQPSRNQLECMCMCSDFGIECQSVSFSEGVCKISPNSQTTSCSYSPPVYKRVNATTSTTTRATTTTVTTKPTTTNATTTITPLAYPSTLPSEEITTTAATTNLALNRPIINNTSPLNSYSLPARTTDGLMGINVVTVDTMNPFVLIDLGTQYPSTELQINIWNACSPTYTTDIEVRISDSSDAADLDISSAFCSYQQGAMPQDYANPQICTPGSSTFRYIKISRLVDNSRLCVSEVEVFRT